jgi:hypothetical protein
MAKTFVAAAIVMLSLSPIMLDRAEAVTLGSPAGIQAAFDQAGIVEMVRHRVCERRCNPYGYCTRHCYYPPHRYPPRRYLPPGGYSSPGGYRY